VADTYDVTLRSSVPMLRISFQDADESSAQLTGEVDQ
jgi:hypothetical protein